jgi:hypothetical protein
MKKRQPTRLTSFKLSPPKIPNRTLTFKPSSTPHSSSPPPARSFTPAAVLEQITKTAARKTPGHDLITADILKHLPRRAVAFITTLFNRILHLHRGVNSVNANSRKQGIADSTSLGEVDPEFSRDGMTVLEFTVPFCDVHALYFMSPELCDSSGSYASEREVICDMSNAKIEILTPV